MNKVIDCPTCGNKTKKITCPGCQQERYVDIRANVCSKACKMRVLRRKAAK